MSGKEYGLILPGKKEKQIIGTRTLNPLLNSDDELENDERDEEGLNWLEASLKKSGGNSGQKSLQKRMVREALQEDATIFQYDEVYDDMKATQTDQREKLKQTQEKKPKYIATILKHTEKRKLENERRQERKIQKEREAEGDEFADKESFVTPSYLKKLEELKKAAEEERVEQLREEQNDVHKHKNFGIFYNHLFKQRLQDTEIKQEPLETSETAADGNCPSATFQNEQKKKNYRTQTDLSEDESSQKIRTKDIKKEVVTASESDEAQDTLDIRPKTQYASVKEKEQRARGKNKVDKSVAKNCRDNADAGTAREKRSRDRDRTRDKADRCRSRSKDRGKSYRDRRSRSRDRDERDKKLRSREKIGKNRRSRSSSKDINNRDRRSRSRDRRSRSRDRNASDIPRDKNIDRYTKDKTSRLVECNVKSKKSRSRSRDRHEKAKRSRSGSNVNYRSKKSRSRDRGKRSGSRDKSRTRRSRSRDKKDKKIIYAEPVDKENGDKRKTDSKDNKSNKLARQSISDTLGSTDVNKMKIEDRIKRFTEIFAKRTVGQRFEDEVQNYYKRKAEREANGHHI